MGAMEGQVIHLDASDSRSSRCMRMPRTGAAEPKLEDSPQEFVESLGDLFSHLVEVRAGPTKNNTLPLLALAISAALGWFLYRIGDENWVYI